MNASNGEQHLDGNVLKGCWTNTCSWRSTIMELCWGGCVAVCSMRGGALVWLYCLDSSKGICWCWEKTGWWKFSSWCREVCTAGLSRCPHWRRTGGLGHTHTQIVSTYSAYVCFLWTQNDDGHHTFSWGAEGWCKAPRWPSSGLRGLLMATYSLLLPMVAFVTSYERVTPAWAGGTRSARGTCV